MKGIRHKTSGIQRVVGWCETTERLLRYHPGASR